MVRLPSEQIDLLEAHYNLLTQWNARLNLTRIESVEDAVRLHYCESLFVGTRLPAGPLRIVDVGSGAGFPGIPIAILRPGVHGNAGRVPSAKGRFSARGEPESEERFRSHRSGRKS